MSETDETKKNVKEMTKNRKKLKQRKKLKILDSEDSKQEKSIKDSTDKEDNVKKVNDENSKAVSKESTKKNTKYILFIGNLPFEVKKEEIEEHFKDIKDSIIGVRLLTDRKTGTGRGCGFLEVKDETSYTKAMQLNLSVLQDRKIRVEFTVPGKSSNKKRRNFIKTKTKKLLKQKKKKHKFNNKKR